MWIVEADYFINDYKLDHHVDIDDTNKIPAVFKSLLSSFTK